MRLLHSSAATVYVSPFFFSQIHCRARGAYLQEKQNLNEDRQATVQQICFPAGVQYNVPEDFLLKIRKTLRGITSGTEKDILSISFHCEHGRDDVLPFRWFEVRYLRFEVLAYALQALDLLGNASVLHLY